ncbi:MAG: hypothetical protein AAF639_32810, partial [Chloroflexota bacterium]
TYTLRMRTYTQPFDTPSANWHPDRQINELWSDYSEVISITTPRYSDEYEQDDDCIDAKAIMLNDMPQQRNFYPVDDDDWMMVIPPKVGSYRIEANRSEPTLFESSVTDIEMRYFTDCDSEPQAEFAESFTPNARLDIQVETAEQPFYIQIKNVNTVPTRSEIAYALSVQFISGTTTLDEGWPPYIAKVDYGETSDDLRVDIRHPDNNYAIDRAWAEVYPYTSTMTMTTTEPTAVIEFHPGNIKPAAWFVGNLNGFTEKTIYRLIFHARDTEGRLAQPVTFWHDNGYRDLLPLIRQ